MLQDGGVDALICRPLYEEGAASMDLIDRLLNGQVFNQSEDTWWQRSQTYFIRRDGEGINGVDRYFDMYKRAEMRFGPLQSRRIVRETVFMGGVLFLQCAAP